MNTKLISLFLLFFIYENEVTAQIYCSNQDSLEWVKLVQLKKENPLETWKAVGSYFIGRKYVAATLEVTGDTALVVNFSGLDCVTFVETVMATVRTLESKTNPTFTDFTKELEFIRYQNGQRNGYVSRLHYTSDWMNENEKKGIGKRVQAEWFNPKTFQLNFMSTHPDSYPLLSDAKNLQGIEEMEKRIKPTLFVLKEEDISKAEKSLKSGDMFGIVTSVKGIDIAHTGFIYKKAGVSYLLHASSANGKVEISEISMQDYLAKSKSNWGIAVFRWIQ